MGSKGTIIHAYVHEIVKEFKNTKKGEKKKKASVRHCEVTIMS